MALAKRLVVIAILSVMLSPIQAQSQNESSQDPDKIKHRIMQMKKRRLIDLLNLDANVEAKFVQAYEAGQSKIDETKRLLDESVRKLQMIVKKKGSEAEISASSDDLLKTYDALVAAQRERVVSLKVYLTKEQYAKLLMFEIRFPEVLQKMILKRGMNAEDGTRKDR